ncbi:MAG: sensor histidine kinase, partial [Pseudomonadales bacterium]
MPSSVARRLVIGVALVGLLALSLVFVSSYVRDNAIEQLQQRTHADLNRYVLTMRQKLARYRDIPQLLSSHPALLSLLRQPASDGLKESANHHLAEVNRVLGTRDTYLMDAQGMTVASSNSASESSFIGRNFSFRPYFKTAMQGELGQYFALGTTSKK